jgi:hypothetical protein
LQSRQSDRRIVGLQGLVLLVADIRYPVVLDNDWANWRRFAVRAWPTAVLVDRPGVVRHVHIGEGAYAETESLIRRLLAEPPPG